MKPLQEYSQKRNFKRTSEPRAVVKKKKSPNPIFVVQEHHSSHLHYDFRLEMNGVLKSWAIPKGPSLDPSIKRLAIEVEDHPISYAKFEGSIPTSQYGGGDVYIWDRGIWESKGDPAVAIEKGRLEFELKGGKLHGRWILLRTRKSARSEKPQWLLIKRSDEYVQKGEADIAMVHDHLNPLKGKGAAPTSASSSHLAKKRTPKEKLLNFRDPQLAQLVEEPPVGPGWIHETKYDGYRTQAHIIRGHVQLFTRTGQDWTLKYPTVKRALEKLKIDTAILDGEIVWIDEKGRSDFQKLQNALKERESTSILFYVFDLLHLNGEDLGVLPLIERKKKLEALLAPLAGTAVLYSEHVMGEAENFLESSCDLQLEGIVSKKEESPYISGRNDNWMKSKCKHRQEFVIGGFTEGEGSRSGFGALLLGVYENKKLKYVGRVGTGFTQESLASLREKLSDLETTKSPFQIKSPRDRGIHWVQPELVAEIAFANWTVDSILRVPVFEGLREDKPPAEIQVERPVQAAPSPMPTKTFDEKEFTHPEKVLFKKEKITKLGIAEYYETVSPWMLPHLSGRPLSVVRCPKGTSGTCFYQKHDIGRRFDPSFHRIQIEEKTGTRHYFSVNSTAGLWVLAQQSAIELHGWNCRDMDVMHPDQIVMDLDPGPDIPWKQVVAGAFAIKRKFERMKLETFVKVTGGKGLHVHIPIEPIYTWNQIKGFSESMARQIEKEDPELYTTTAARKSRWKKIYIDHLRNAQSATVVIPYSLRAKGISSVAIPLEWEELEEIKEASAFTFELAIQKIRSRDRDPWSGFLSSSRKIKLLEEAKKN